MQEPLSHRGRAKSLIFKGQTTFHRSQDQCRTVPTESPWASRTGSAPNKSFTGLLLRGFTALAWVLQNPYTSDTGRTGR